MIRLFFEQSRHLENLTRYSAVVTHSAAMQREFITNGLDPKRIYNLTYGTHPENPDNTLEPLRVCQSTALSEAEILGRARRESKWRLLFVGRMDLLKGGHLFLQALPRILECLRAPVHVIFAGDGPSREAWARQARQLQTSRGNLRVDFVGWLDSVTLHNLMRSIDLLIVPSLWPEPFGLVGPEAARLGIPAVAFDVGGISEWLKDGTNGFLAPGDPPTAEGLADAILKCLYDPEIYERLRIGAEEIVKRFEMKRHLASLLNVLDDVVAKESQQSLCESVSVSQP